MDTAQSLAILEQQIHRAESEWMNRKAKYDVLMEELSEVEAKWSALQQEKDLLDQVRILFQKASDHARQQAKQQLEHTVTSALRMVFGHMFTFEIELSEPGKSPSAEFYVVTEWEGSKIRNKPQDARGGGVIDIVSLALRVALILIMKPTVDGPLILDEPGKHVSKDFVVPMIDFLKSISETFGRQIILVTHNNDLTESADQVFHVRITSGKSEVQAIASS